jgi:hypothetical protein
METGTIPAFRGTAVRVRLWVSSEAGLNRTRGRRYCDGIDGSNLLARGLCFFRLDGYDAAVIAVASRVERFQLHSSGLKFVNNCEQELA